MWITPCKRGTSAARGKDDITYNKNSDIGVQLPQTACVFNSYRVVEREESVLLPRATLVPRLHGVIQIEVLRTFTDNTTFL